jgi:hypothetical protein
MNHFENESTILKWVYWKLIFIEYYGYFEALHYSMKFQYQRNLKYRKETTIKLGGGRGGMVFF